MATYDDIGKNAKFAIDLEDELKPNQVDLLLPYADLESGWILVSRGSLVTINHNFGKHPRLMTIIANVTASFSGTCQYEIGANIKSSFSTDSMSDNTVTIKNDSRESSYKYVFVRLWR